MPISYFVILFIMFIIFFSCLTYLIIEAKKSYRYSLRQRSALRRRGVKTLADTKAGI